MGWAEEFVDATAINELPKTGADLLRSLKKKRSEGKHLTGSDIAGVYRLKKCLDSCRKYFAEDSKESA